MKGKLLLGKKERSLNDEPSLKGFTGTLSSFSSLGARIPLLTLFMGIIFIALYSFFLSSCRGLTFEEENTGEIKFVFNRNVETKSVVREFPDSNKFILTIKNSSGTIVYNDLYGKRPSKMELNAGSYEISVFSREFTKPEFDAPCFGDNKTVIVKAGEVCVISLSAVQTNLGIRLTFTNDFIKKFPGYTAELADTAGKLTYPFTETRFAYLNPGPVTLNLLELPPYGEDAVQDTIPVISREMSQKDMLTVNLHANPSDTSSATSGIIIDTTARWLFEQIVVGAGDGKSKATAFNTAQLSSNIGAKGVWVTGYIVGGDLTSTAISFTPPFTKETNLAIASSASERVRTNCISVSIPNNELRALLNLCANPGNLGKRVYIQGTIVASYLGLIGLNPVTDAQF